MNRIKYRISLDMFEVATQTTIKAKKGDTACSIYITLTENGKIYNITDGCYAVFSAKKPDGNYIFNSDTCSIEDNAIVYDFTEQTVPCEGVVECEVILFKGEQKLTSPCFNIVVDGTVYNGEEIVSSTSIDVFEQMVEETSENKFAAAESAEAARISAETADDAANTAEKAAELAVNAREGIEQEIANSLMEAKNSGEFDGKDGKDGKDGADYILTDDDKSEIAAQVSGDCVSYSEAQALTDEQKEIARQNIGVFSQDTVAQMIIGSFEKAVPKSLVVDNLVADKQLLTDHIPNGQAVQSFIVANSVSSAVAQTLSDSKKQIARTNIGAISQAELDEAVANVGGGSSEEWETIADITLAEVTNGITVSQDINGQAFSLKKAKIIVDIDNTSGFYTATGNLILTCVSEETNVLSRAMFLYNAIPNTAGRYGRTVFEIEVVSGLAFVSGRCFNNLKKLANTEFGDSFSFSANLPFSLKNGILNTINIGTNHSSGLAAGTRLQVLGVRA